MFCFVFGLEPIMTKQRAQTASSADSTTPPLKKGCRPR